MSKKLKKVLLIVEDDSSMLKLYHDIFEIHGFEVELASDGVEGLKKAKDVKPAIIVLDLMMPKMDGIEVLEHLKGDESTKDIPVVVLTNIARDSLGLTEEALKKGAVKYLVKSDYEPDEVVEIINRVLSSSSSKETPKEETFHRSSQVK